MGSTEHLGQHQFQVEGDERLAKTPLSVRLYASDDEQVRTMSDRGQFIRDAVRRALLRRLELRVTVDANAEQSCAPGPAADRR